METEFLPAFLDLAEPVNWKKGFYLPHVVEIERRECKMYFKDQRPLMYVASGMHYVPPSQRLARGLGDNSARAYLNSKDWKRVSFIRRTFNLHPVLSKLLSFIGI